MLGLVGAAFTYVEMQPHDRMSFVAEAAAPDPVAARLSRQDFAGWAYYDTSDPLVGTTTQHAVLHGHLAGAADTGRDTALEVEQTGLPSGASTRRVIVTFPAARRACNANPCDVRLVWDDAPPETYAWQDLPTADPGRATVELSEYDRFIGALSKAKELKVVAAFGMPDDYVVTFPVDGFNPAKAR